MQLFDDAFTVLVFVMVGAGVLVVHAKAHRVVEQDSDLACRRGDGFGVANARGEPSVDAPSAVLVRPTVTGSVAKFVFDEF